MNLKFLLLTLVFSFLSSISFCQTQKGKLVLSGKTDVNFLFSNVSIGTDSIETGSTKSNQYGFTGGIGYIIANNLSIGVFGTNSYNYSEVKSSNYLPQTTKTLPRLLLFYPSCNIIFRWKES